MKVLSSPPVADGTITRAKLAAASFKTARSAATAIAAGATTTTTIPFAAAFADTNYTFSVTVRQTIAGGDCRYRRSTNKLAGSVDVVINNADAINASEFVIEVIAIHD